MVCSCFYQLYKFQKGNYDIYVSNIYSSSNPLINYICVTLVLINSGTNTTRNQLKNQVKTSSTRIFSHFLPNLYHIFWGLEVQFFKRNFLKQCFSSKCVLFLAHDCRLVLMRWSFFEFRRSGQSFLAIIWRLSISFRCHYLFISPFSVSCLCENAWWILIVVYKMLHKLNQRSKFKNTQEMRARDR